MTINALTGWTFSKKNLETGDVLTLRNGMTVTVAFFAHKPAMLISKFDNGLNRYNLSEWDECLNHHNDSLDIISIFRPHVSEIFAYYRDNGLGDMLQLIFMRTGENDSRTLELLHKHYNNRGGDK